VCALDAEGRVFCWGSHGLGQLAVGPYEGAGAHRSAPAPAADSARFRSVALGVLLGQESEGRNRERHHASAERGQPFDRADTCTRPRAPSLNPRRLGFRGPPTRRS
ncbi:MAG: hypothetical protein ACREMI_08105, partial [Gemmatimonadales bacterium]